MDREECVVYINKILDKVGKWLDNPVVSGVEGGETIGRNAARCDLVLDEVAVSAEHARIRYERRQLILYDLASTNGTFLNGQRVERAALSDGDAVTIGGVRMVSKEVQPSQ